MRDIKFSCMWHDGKTWMDLRYTLDEMCNGDHWNDMSAQASLRRFALKHKRQYTGLKDANGVEIYEGDLIELYNNKNGCAQVVFENAYVGGWVLTVPQNKHDPLSLGARKASDIEIIGNIYENPELLEGIPSST